jgi:hypothetical protein
MPPGRAKLSTEPAPTGSTACANTIGTARLADKRDELAHSRLLVSPRVARVTPRGASFVAAPQSEFLDGACIGPQSNIPQISYDIPMS